MGIAAEWVPEEGPHWVPCWPGSCPIGSASWHGLGSALYKLQNWVYHGYWSPASCCPFTTFLCCFLTCLWLFHLFFPQNLLIQHSQCLLTESLSVGALSPDSFVLVVLLCSSSAKTWVGTSQLGLFMLIFQSHLMYVRFCQWWQRLLQRRENYWEGVKGCLLPEFRAVLYSRRRRRSLGYLIMAQRVMCFSLILTFSNIWGILASTFRK